MNQEEEAEAALLKRRLASRAPSQDDDLIARVNQPSWYTAHCSGIEAIELIEHLPANLANAVKYIWRCGLKKSETPLRELLSARWYTEREMRRVELYELEGERHGRKTDVVWRALARRVIFADPNSTLGRYLDALLRGPVFDEMLIVLGRAISECSRPEGR